MYVDYKSSYSNFGIDLAIYMRMMEDSCYQIWIGVLSWKLHYPMDEQCDTTSLINPPVELAWLKIQWSLSLTSYAAK